MKIRMKKKFNGCLFNRIEILGGREFNHIGCEGESEEFINFIAQFVPEVGMKRKVKFMIESQGEVEEVEGYKIAKDYNEDEK